MLNLEISKGGCFERSGSLDVSIHVKPSSQGKPLCYRSWHQPTVHTSWPYSRLLHFEKCCNHVEYFRSSSFRLFGKLRISSPGHPTLATIADSISEGYPKRNGKQAKNRHQVVSRLILPYHPCFQRLSSRLLLTHKHFDRANKPDLKPAVVFSLGGVSLFRLLQSDCRSKLKSYLKPHLCGSGR